MPNVDWIRNEVENRLISWMLVRDVMDGELAVKAKRSVYLPIPNSADVTPQNLARYDAYILRAVFTGVTGRTHKGMIGQIFLRPPEVDIPTELDILKTDADGSNTTLDQIAQICCGSVLAYGRCGLLIDYPTVNGTATKADLANGDIRPTITHYEPWDIINWATTKIGAKKVLTLVVLREYLNNSDDGFAITYSEQYRVLRLDPATNTHYVEIWHKGANTSPEMVDMFEPLDSKGLPFTSIPFMFLGASTNDEKVDHMPLYDIASVNLAHYRNSADYEEGNFLAGQPTLWASGLTENWLNDVLGGSFSLGGRGGLALPANGQAGILQTVSNSGAFEAMQQKMDLMMALGAKLIVDQQQGVTATAVSSSNTSENSILTNIAMNVEAAIKAALTIAYSFISSSVPNIVYTLNKDFDFTTLDPQMVTQVQNLNKNGLITLGEARNKLKKGGLATLPDDEAKKQIDKEQALLPDENPDKPIPPKKKTK